MKKILNVFLFVFFVACSQSSPTAVEIHNVDPVLEEFEITKQVLDVPALEINVVIREAVNSGKLTKASSFAVLAQKVRRITLPRHNPAGTFRTLSEGFARLPKEELTALNIDIYLSELPQGYKTRAAVLLLETDKLDREARDRTLYYYDELDQEQGK